MGSGLQAMQLSPCHAGLAEPRLQRLISALGCVGRRLSPCPFGLREAADPRISSASFPSTMGMLHKLLRRTGRWRPSPARPGWVALWLVRSLGDAHARQPSAIVAI